MRRLVIILCLLFSALVGVQTANAQQYSMSECYATTVCARLTPWGVQTYSIACRVRADATTGTACSWFVIPGQYVECSGLNAYGMWGTVYFSCN